VPWKPAETLFKIYYLVIVAMMPVAEVTATKVAAAERESEDGTVVGIRDKVPLRLPAACPNPIVCKRRRQNPSLKRPDCPVAPEQKSGSR
jgi:hypothetical protein